MKQQEKQYRFAAIADVHIDLENHGENTYFIYAERNFRRALEVCAQRGCKFILSAGDQVTNASGAAEEWQRYREIIEQSSYHGLILEAMGNHETRYAKYGGCTLEECCEEFIRCTRLREKPVERAEGKPYYAYLDDRFGDAFVVLALENGVDTNRIDNFSKEQMDWAEDRIERWHREGRRIFLIQHAPIERYGAGDDPESPAYRGSMRLYRADGSAIEGNRRFYRLTRRYRDMIWLSGHTHVDLRDGVNYSNDHGEGCHMLHIPALAGTTRLSYDENGGRTLDRRFFPDATQGYLADIYEDRVVFSGVNFYEDAMDPAYRYVIGRKGN